MAIDYDNGVALVVDGCIAIEGTLTLTLNSALEGNSSQLIGALTLKEGLIIESSCVTGNFDAVEVMVNGDTSDCRQAEATASGKGIAYFQ